METTKLKLAPRAPARCLTLFTPRLSLPARRPPTPMGPFGPRLIDSSCCWVVAQATSTRWQTRELTSIFADLTIFAAYAVIPLLIVYFLLRRRRVHFSRLWFLLVVYL